MLQPTLIRLLIATLSGPLLAGNPQKVWELDLKNAIGPSRSYKVVGLAFSPDAQQIAVRLMDKVVLFRAQGPKTVLGQFQSLSNHVSFGCRQPNNLFQKPRRPPPQTVKPANRPGMHLFPVSSAIPRSLPESSTGCTPREF